VYVIKHHEMKVRGRVAVWFPVQFSCTVYGCEWADLQPTYCNPWEVQSDITCVRGYWNLCFSTDKNEDNKSGNVRLT